MDMRNLSVFLLCVAGFTLTNASAAPKPDPVNADFFANPHKIETLALVVDTVIVEDIEGKIGGINRTDHRLLVPVIGHGVRHALEARGYRVKELHASAGLFATGELKFAYIDRNKQITGERMTYPFDASTAPPWARGPIQMVLEGVLTGAGPKRKPAGAYSVELPLEIKNLGVDAVAIVTSTSVNVSDGKRIGWALAGPAGLGGLIGGAIQGAILSAVNEKEGAIATIVDARDGTVLWFDEAQGTTNPNRGGTRMIRHTLFDLLMKLPNRGTPALEAAGATFGGTPSVFEDPAGWSAAEIRTAFRAGAIPEADYKTLSRELAVKYRDRIRALRESRKNDQITEHEYDIELFRWEWSYRGFY